MIPTSNFTAILVRHYAPQVAAALVRAKRRGDTRLVTDLAEALARLRALSQEPRQ